MFIVVDAPFFDKAQIGYAVQQKTTPIVQWTMSAWSLNNSIASIQPVHLARIHQIRDRSLTLIYSF